MAPRLRSPFVRQLVDAMSRGPAEPSAARGRLPERLQLLAAAVQHSADPSETMPLDDAEELLLALDAALGDGHGRLLEAAARDVAARAISQRDGLIVAGDVLATLQRLRVSLEHPFCDDVPSLELRRTDAGVEMTASLAGRPRTARLLRHLATGVVRAAVEFSREAALDAVQIDGAVIGDRARIEARFRRAQSSAQPQPPERRSMRARRPPSITNLSAVVDEILGPRRSLTPALGMPAVVPRSSTPAAPAPQVTTPAAPAPSPRPQHPAGGARPEADGVEVPRAPRLPGDPELGRRQR